MAGAVRTVYAYSLAFNPVKAKFGREERGMKLLGVAELADGSLHFAFGVAPEGSSSSGNVLDTPLAAQPQVASNQLPVRLPSSFQKKSPISISTERRQLPTRSRERLTKEGELSRPGTVAEDVMCADVRKETAHVLDRVEKNTSHFSQESAGRQTTSSRKTAGHSVPTRMKSKFVKKTPVPSGSGAIHTTVDSSSNSSVTRAGAERSPAKINPQITTSETSFSTRGDIAVDISVQTGSVITETVREQVTRDTQTSTKSTSGTLPEGSGNNSAAFAGDSQEVAALNIQGLSVSISSPNAAEKSVEVVWGTKAAGVETLSAYKLADLKSMAKNRGLKGYSKLKKGELIELLSKQDH